MVDKKRVVTFDRTVIGLLAGSAVAVVVAAGMLPPSGVTLAPKAHFEAPSADKTRHALGGHAVAPEQLSKLRSLTVGTVARTFSNLNYDLDKLRAGDSHVPPVFLISLPVDMSKIRVPEERKQLFFKSVLPIVLRVNAEIRRDRERIAALHEMEKRGEHVAAEDRLWLAAMAERYNTERGDLTALLRRVDYIPPSMALAQAAEESGWGTSRFAREGNALFGQWTFSRSKNGLVPRGRDNGKSHRIRSFASLLDAARAYAHNLNTHRAYRPFRDRRMAMREAGRPLDGIELVRTMNRYSERGERYVRSLRVIILANKLSELDHVRLSDERIASLPKPLI
jgi:Bax protein